MRTAVLSIAALAAVAAGAGTADAQYVVRRGVVYAAPYPGYYVAPGSYVAPGGYVVPGGYVAPAAAVVPAPPITAYAAPAAVVVPAPVVSYGYYPVYRAGWRVWR
ncbi:MAG: hypothetical protein U0804_08810 [Gemmataceae bacterium]